MKAQIAKLSSRKLILTGTLALSTLVLLGTTLVSAPSFAETGKRDGKVCHGKKHHAPHKMKFKRPFQDKESFISMMERHVELSDAQKTTIASVFEQYQAKLDELHKQMQSMRDTERELLQEETLNEDELATAADEKARLISEMFVVKTRLKHAVRAELTTEQRAEMEKHMQKKHERFEHKQKYNNDSSINPARLNVNPVLSPFVSVHI